MTITQPSMWRHHHQELRYGYSGNIIRCWPTHLGEVVDVTTPAVSVYFGGPDSTALTSPTVSEANTHLLTATIDCSNTTTWGLGTGYRAEWTWSYNSQVHRADIDLQVVRVPLVDHCPVVIDDLKNAYSPVDEALTQLGQASDAHQRYILPAWEDVLNFVESQGYRPALVSTNLVLRPMTLYRSLVKLCEGLTRKDGDVWSRKREGYLKDYEDARSTTVLHYDESDNKGQNAVTNWRQPRLLIGPPLT